MEKLALPFLQRLAKESSGRYGNPAVKKASDDLIALLSSSLAESTTPAATPPPPGGEDVFACLLLACQSKQPKLMVIALDCLEKLLAFELVARNNNAEEQTSVIKTIGQCADTQDDAVQLQVVKALLTAVSTGVAHEGNLLLALRACYHIHLVSDNAVNRTTAKISLTQMITYLFEKDRKEAPAATSAAPVPPTTPTATAQEEETGQPRRIEGMYSEVQQMLCFALLVEEEAEPAAAAAAAPPASASAASAIQLDFPSVSFKDAFLVLRTLSKLSMKAISFDDVTFAVVAEDGTTVGEEEDRRADPRALKSKLLSLELISQAITTGGDMLRQSDALVFAIKHYLFPALMKNCMETNLQVAQLAVRIFEQLVGELKTIKLKKDVELLISNIFLSGLLDSPHASYESRHMVCECLNRMCQRLPLLCELFLNYDCDLGSKGLLRAMADSLHRLAVTNSQMPDVRKLSRAATACLSSLAKSLAGFTPTAASTATATAEEDIAEEATASLHALSTFQQKQQNERELKHGLQLFNHDKKPSKAIAYWRERKLLADDSALTLAQFLLHNSNMLSKTQIGEVLGGDSDESKLILSAYVSLFDFTNQQIDLAIRQFLSHFRIPGEAQKVDRVFENFASRYWEANKTEFPNADCAFVLSFAIIMLQTDAHNPNIRPEKKMKKLDFLKNNRGIASGRDMSAEFLGGIYDRIVANAITMKGEDLDYKHANGGAGANTNGADDDDDQGDAKGKRRAFFRQREAILRTVAGGGGAASPAAQEEDEVYYQVEAVSADHVAAMFTLVWQQMRDSFVACFLGTDDGALASLCLEGVFNSIRCAARFHLDEERDALLGVLAQLTKLSASREIQPKNVMCVQALCTLAVSEANYLGTGWFTVLQCVSELARLLAMNENSSNDDDDDEGAGPVGASAASSKPRPELKAVAMLKRVMDLTQIDRIFMGSEQLTDTAVVDFVAALARVSRDELGGGNKKRSRVFSLQKLVEVADFNLATRGRVCWGKMWAILGEHFVSAGCHGTVKVALYAVDSLKQLSLKFLNREEFVGFNFQDAFLRPFEQIELQSQSAEVRSLVLSCMQLIVVSKSRTVKSGWGAVFDVIAASAKADDTNAKFGFSVLELCAKYNAPKHLFALCALKFANTRLVDLCTKCFSYVEHNCATRAYLPPSATATGEEDAGSDEPRLVLQQLQQFVFAEQRPEIQRVAFNVVLVTFRNAQEDRAPAGIVIELFKDFLHQWRQAGGARGEFQSLDYVVSETAQLVGALVCETAAATAAAVQLEEITKCATQQSKREIVYLPVLQSWVDFVQEELLCSQHAGCVQCGVHTLDALLKKHGQALSQHAWQLVVAALGKAVQHNSPSRLSDEALLVEFRLVGQHEEEERGRVSLEEIAAQEDGMVLDIVSRRSSVASAAPSAAPVLFNATAATATSSAYAAAVKLVCRLRVRELKEPLAALLEQVLKHASEFNDYHALRVELASRDFTFPHDASASASHHLLPDFLECEVASALTLLKCFSTDNEQRYERVVELLMKRYLRQDRILAAETTLFVRGLVDTVGSSKSTGSERELGALTPVVLLALRSVLDLDGKKEQVGRTLKWAFPLLLELIECPNRDVRAVVKKILEKHVTPRLAL